MTDKYTDLENAVDALGDLVWDRVFVTVDTIQEGDENVYGRRSGTRYDRFVKLARTQVPELLKERTEDKAEIFRLRAARLSGIGLPRPPTDKDADNE